MEKDQIRAALQNLDDLPVPPAVAIRILEIIEQDRADIKELAQVITYDPSISAKILRLANSAYYGFTRKIASVQQAIVLLGFNTVRSLTLSIAIFETLSSRGHTRGSLDRQQLWLHSVGCASAAQSLGKLGKLSSRDVAFTAGLLHDVGKLVLDTLFPSLYHQVLQKVSDDHVTFYEAERDIFGTDHAEVGGWLGQRWKFPPMIAEPIAAHHTVEETAEEYLEIVVTINTADTIVQTAQIGLSSEAPSSYHYEVLNRIGLSEQSIELCAQQLQQDRHRLETFSFT
jgi:HD-like signal output (HDOD) protein